MTVRLKPTEDRILVLPFKPKETSKGGIVIPASAQEADKNKGTVIVTGPGRMMEDGNRLPMTVAAGDTVYFSRFGAGEPYEEDGVTYSLMRLSDILGTLEGVTQ
jgi:chaperonin GroES